MAPGSKLTLPYDSLDFTYAYIEKRLENLNSNFSLILHVD